MHVLVTGGTGLVGHGIQDVYKEFYHSDSSVQFTFLGSKDANLLDRASTLALFAKLKPSHVIHCAARVGGLFLNMRSPVELGRENILMAENVMEACALHKCVLVSFLSTCIFPDKTTYPIDETMLHNGPPQYV